MIWPAAIVNETVTLQMCPGDNKVKGKVKGKHNTAVPTYYVITCLYIFV